MVERLRPHSHCIVQAVWVVFAVAGSVFWVAVPISQWAQLQTVCRQASTCTQYQLGPAAARSLGQHGISLTGYAIYTAAALVIGWAVWYGLAALVIWRKPGDRGAVVAAYFLIVFPLLGPSLWVSWAGVVSLVSLASLVLFGLLFPDGRFTPLDPVAGS